MRLLERGGFDEATAARLTGVRHAASALPHLQRCLEPSSHGGGPPQTKDLRAERRPRVYRAKMPRLGLTTIDDVKVPDEVRPNRPRPTPEQMTRERAEVWAPERAGDPIA